MSVRSRATDKHAECSEAFARVAPRNRLEHVLTRLLLCSCLDVVG